jgi:ubiquinone biosynthesis protein UbiJ
MEAPRRGGYLVGMDSETGAAFTALNEMVTALGEKVTAGFARMDRHFEIQHKWVQDWIDEMRHEREVRRRTDALSKRVARLEQEIEPPREQLTQEIADTRLELCELRYEAWQIDYLHRPLAALTERVDRLDPRRRD